MGASASRASSRAHGLPEGDRIGGRRHPATAGRGCFPPPSRARLCIAKQNSPAPPSSAALRPRRCGLSAPAERGSPRRPRWSRPERPSRRIPEQHPGGDPGAHPLSALPGTAAGHHRVGAGQSARPGAASMGDDHGPARRWPRPGHLRLRLATGGPRRRFRATACLCTIDPSPALRARTGRDHRPSGRPAAPAAAGLRPTPTRGEAATPSRPGPHPPAAWASPPISSTPKGTRP